MDEYEVNGDRKNRLLPVILLVIFLYILLLGRQGVAVDLVIDSNLAYLATGSEGGLRILDLSDPIRPREIGFYDTPGTASRVTMAGKRAFIADGRAGLRILDVSDPQLPVAIGHLEPGGNTEDVALGGSFAYLSLGSDGVAVVDISDQGRPLLISRIDTPGSAENAAVMQVFVAPPGVEPGTPEFNQQATIQSVYLYVADGPRGLQVIDMTVPTAPRIIGEYNTRGVAVDIEMTGFIGFVADGRSGFVVFDLRSPTEPQVITEVETDGYTHDVSLFGSRLYVANGEEGAAVYDIGNLAEPVLWKSYSGIQGVESVAGTGGQYTYLAAGSNGLRVIDMGENVSPYQVGFYETPGEASIGQIIQGTLLAVQGRVGDIQPKVGRTLLSVFFDGALLFVLLGFWLAFFSQFTLPVRRLIDRRRAASRLVAYHLGTRGPAIFLENGQIKSRLREERRNGPGVAIIDTASATVLRTEHSFTRAVGPGIVFTRRKEFPAGVIDLRPQVSALGPMEDDAPFAHQGEEEAPEAFAERQSRRYQTSSLTRDGVEVVPNVAVVFRLNSYPGEGGSQYGYNPAAVWKAVAREGIDPRADHGSSRRNISWAWLPARVAVDLWREHLRKFTLDELFMFTDASEPKLVDSNDPENGNENNTGIPETGGDPLPRTTAFDEIMRSIRERMTQLEVDELDEFGRKTGVRKPSKEYELLSGRGIKVLGVSIRNLRFPEDVETRLIQQWQATWLERAKDEAQQVESIQAQRRLEGQDSASKVFAQAASQLLRKDLDDENEFNLRETLRLLVQGTLKLTVREVDLAPRLTNQKASLVELIEWIGKQ